MSSNKYTKIVIGIDQSYPNSGITIIADKVIKRISSINTSDCTTNSSKRAKISSELNKVLAKLDGKSKEIICIIERIRLRSDGFINIDYIKSIGALNCLIIDCCSKYGIKVYSVDTRCWKSQVIGTSKPKANKYGVPPEKWPTVEWLLKKGFEDKILIEINGRKNKGTFVRDGQKYMYNNDAADSAGIAMFGFVGDPNKLQEEK